MAVIGLLSDGGDMSVTRQTVVRTAAAAFYRARGHKLLAPFTRGCGAILMLHSISAEPRPAFDPNGGLCVTPDFLERAICLVRREGYDVVSLDEVHQRLTSGSVSKPFVAFTLDDGYRDNLKLAYPIFQRHQVPFCVYVPTAFADGRADLWWYGLEGAIRSGRTLRLAIDGSEQEFTGSSLAEQRRAWQQIYWWLRRIGEDQARQTVTSLCAQAGLDTTRLAQELIMTWQDVRQLAADPLCTIGAHTVNHSSLAKLDANRCGEEIIACKTELELRLGKPVRHFSYPYGSPADAGQREFALAAEAGFATAVTTRKGLIFKEHRAHLTALPRLSLNGGAQDERLLAVLLGGAPFALVNGFRRVSTA